MCNVPPGSQLQVLVEIPDRQGHLEEFDARGRPAASTDVLSWMAEELPVLAAVSTKQDATEAPFDITDEALHVSKYIKAYDNGTIDELYGAGGGPKVRHAEGAFASLL